MLGAKRLLELVEPQDLGGKQRVVAHRNLCLGPPDAKHMSGGSQFAAAIRLLERVTGEPLIEASCQFRKSPKVGEELEIEIDHLRQGRSITQAGMSLAINCEAGAKISASLGKRDDIGSHQWWQAPNVPRAEDCEPLRFIRCDPGDQHGELDFRFAAPPSTLGPGQLSFWVRWDDEDPVSSPFLALLADYLPEANHWAIGRPAGALSLDNAIRIIARPRTEWVLCHAQLAAIADGLYHGEMRLYSAEGALLALAHQSGVVRLF
ncbi:thioesterase family protein [Parerythrobacter aurantius]|uniref:thioesterase family protein n=1 Tax=Parerythrobacter aurantius TaxID=3127706 RepID=UPI003248C15E